MNAVHGFGKYVSFVTRRERFIALIWMLCLVATTVAVTAIYPTLLGTHEEMVGMAEALNIPAMRMLVGPVYALENGGAALSATLLMAQSMLLFSGIVLIIMNIFMVVRHTRGDEERGRLEMLRSLPLGRMTNACATLFAAVIVNILIAVIMTVSIFATGVDGMTFEGAAVYSAALAATGILFAAIALLAAQFFTTERGAITFSMSIMGFMYIVRGIGDMNPDGSMEVLSYITPLGLILRVYSFRDNAVWPILVLLLQAVVVAGIALFICARRDLGEGLVPARKGRKHASKWMLSPFGFMWRLNRGSFIAWGITFFLLGLTYGAVTDMELLLENEMFGQMIQAGIPEEQIIEGQALAAEMMIKGYIAMIMMIMSIIITIPVVGAMTKFLSEEKRGRMEQIYGRAVSRVNVYLSCVIQAVIMCVVLQFLVAFGLFAADTTDSVTFKQIMQSVFSFTPGVLTIAGLGALTAGIAPRFKSVVWFVFGYTIFVSYIGRTIQLPEIFEKFTPFGHIAHLPVQDFKLMPIAVFSITAIVLIVAGVLGYRNRDIDK